MLPLTVAQLVDGEVRCSYLGPTPRHNVIDVKKWFLVVCDLNSYSKGNASTHKQAQLITMHKDRAMKGMVVCWMFLNLISNSGR